MEGQARHMVKQQIAQKTENKGIRLLTLVHAVSLVGFSHWTNTTEALSTTPVSWGCSVMVRSWRMNEGQMNVFK